MTYGPGTPIVVVGAIASSAVVAADEIRAALGHPREMGRGSEFLGRNTTRVFADDRVVLKVRPDLEIPYRGRGDAMADRATWIEARLERERAIRGYPDDRSWVLLGEGDHVVAGIASRRRRPLHLWTPDELAGRWEWFAREFGGLYLRAANENWRLDEGLSNFAPDAGADSDSELPARAAPVGPLRYLDDDLYVWDRGVGLRLAMGVLARREPWLTAEQGEHLGAVLRDELEQYPPLLDTRDVADGLRLDASGSEFLRGLGAALGAPRKARRAPRER